MGRKIRNPRAVSIENVLRRTVEGKKRVGIRVGPGRKQWPKAERTGLWLGLWCAARESNPQPAQPADSRGGLVVTARELSYLAPTRRFMLEWRSLVRVLLHPFALKGAG